MPGNGPTGAEWWRGAVIYQIYPRSLMDSNGDGVGDLQGIIDKLDYIGSLGVDAVWISPFFKSPMRDFGYDVSDYRDVDPLFGSLEDFDRLVAEAHRRGLKIIIDQVLSHSSDQHPWFEQSRQSRDNPKADWYVWADPKPDGTPPNNWLSIFGGGAWQWEPRRLQYYMHTFLVSQPDLNFHNPEVREQMLQEVDFWLKRGVDGFRLDAINFCFHDKLLRDNPPKPIEKHIDQGYTSDNPYRYQYHIYNCTRPENLQFIERLRALLDKYPASLSLGEISAEDSLATTAEYTRGNKRLHMCYNFALLNSAFDTGKIRSVIETLEQRLVDGWPCWTIGNHDVVRVLTRWGGDRPRDDLAKVLTAFLFSLRGSLCSYQGEELGLTEAEIGWEQLRDPYARAFWPLFKGRDGCRTPLPWNNQDEFAGFSSVPPWLPIPEEHRLKAVAEQEQDPDSVLNAYRTFLQWRRGQPALRYGNIEFIDAPAGTLAFWRRYRDENLLACFNFTNKKKSLPLPADLSLESLGGHGFPEVRCAANQLLLSPYTAGFAKCSSSV